MVINKDIQLKRISIERNNDHELDEIIRKETANKDQHPEISEKQNKRSLKGIMMT